MKIRFTDNQDQVLSNLEIYFEYSKTKKAYFTDDEGFVEFTDAGAGIKIACYTNPKEKQRFTLDPEKEIVIKLNPPEVDMVFVAESVDGKYVAGANVFFEYLGNKIEKTSNLFGQIILEKIPVNTEVKVYQIVKGEEQNFSLHICDKNKQQYAIAVENPLEFTSMKIKLVDKSGQAIRNTDVRIKTLHKEFDTVSGQDGYILIDNIEVGSTIECKQIMGGKMFPWHKLKCEVEVDEYILHGERPTIYANYSDKIDSQVRMKFRLVNSKGIPIPNAVLKIEYSDKVRNKYSNQYGETMIDDVLIGDKIKIYVDIRGKNTETEFICQEDNEQHDIVLRTNKIPLYFWIVPLFLLIVFLIYYANSSSTGVKEENSKKTAELKKDSIIINNYSFFIKSAKTDLPIAETKIKLLYRDTIIEKLTDKKGIAVFKAFTHILPLKYEIDKLGYASVNQSFKLDSIFSIKLAQNDSVEIDPVLGLCGNEIQSKGAKTTIKSFKMNLPKGKFSIWYNLFAIPTKVDIYKGAASKMSTSNLIFSNNGYMKGITNTSIILDSPDSLITVCFDAKAGNTSWVYKVYCVKLPIKQISAPINNTQVGAQ